MFNRIFSSAMKIMALIALPVLSSLSPSALAGNFPAEAGPCGTLTKLGNEQTFSYIYNNSLYKWNVVFETKLVDNYNGIFNAGAIKYLANGWWLDTGVGDYTKTKSYIVPVIPGQTVKIAYCADTAVSAAIMDGVVYFVLTDTYMEHGSPDDRIGFRGVNDTPTFYNSGTTAYVSYNKKPADEWETGSLIICPTDPYCRTP